MQCFYHWIWICVTVWMWKRLNKNTCVYYDNVKHVLLQKNKVSSVTVIIHIKVCLTHILASSSERHYLGILSKSTVAIVTCSLKYLAHCWPIPVSQSETHTFSNSIHKLQCIPFILYDYYSICADHLRLRPHVSNRTMCVCLFPGPQPNSFSPRKH